MLLEANRLFEYPRFDPKMIRCITQVISLTIVKMETVPYKNNEK